MSELFAGLARRALRPLAIGPRLPSRFETPLAAGAAFTPAPTSPPATEAAAGNQAPSAPATAHGHLPVPDTAPIAVRTQPGVAKTPETPVHQRRIAAPPMATVMTEAGAPRPRHATLDPRADTAHHATPAQATAAATTQLAPLVVPLSAPATQAQVASAALGEASASPRRMPDARPVAAVPRGVAAQRLAGLERLEPPHRVDAPARPAITPATGSRATLTPPPPAAPRVDITIGSIDVVFTSVPAPAAPRAPATAAPAVQSLDDYLQSRQRRGGPR